MPLSTINPQFFSEEKWIVGTVGGNPVMSRPADVTPYAAGDEVSDNIAAGSANPWTFANVVAQNGAPFAIHRIVMRTNSSVAPGGSGFLLRLFTVAPAMSGDNAALAGAEVAYDNMITVCQLQVLSVATAGGELISTFEATTPRLALCAPAASTIYGEFQISAAYVPTSGQQFKMKILVFR